MTPTATTSRRSATPPTSSLPAPVEAAVGRYLARADRLLPGRVVGFHVVGSVALGAYRHGRSDIDFVSVLDRALEAGELRRLRAVFLSCGVRSAVPDLLRGRITLPDVCNGVFVREEDLPKPVTTIVPVASHAGHGFHVGRGFDVNPVVWKTFASKGITVRGRPPSELGLDREPGALVAWNRANLGGYWRSQGERLLAGGDRLRMRLTPRWVTAWCVTGPPRLHHTIATGEVISKEAAAEYARDAFDPRWHPLIDEALAYWRGQPAPDAARFAGRRRRAEETGRFVLEVVEAAAALPG